MGSTLSIEVIVLGAPLSVQIVRCGHLAPEVPSQFLQALTLDPIIQSQPRLREQATTLAQLNDFNRCFLVFAAEKNLSNPRAVVAIKALILGVACPRC